jgi:AcrR family transcriptional regulator
MEKKEIQEQRMKSYFIDAAKSMIRGEGVRSISVRRVADEAGYSYATLYNYFKDMRDLLFICVNDFLEECRAFIFSDPHPDSPGPERIKSITKSYVRYFIQYPGTFELMFLEKMSEIQHNENIGDAIYIFLDDLLAEDWKVYAAHYNINKPHLGEIRNAFKSVVHGEMLFYLNRRIPKDYSEFMKNFNTSIDHLLRQA